MIHIRRKCLRTDFILILKLPIFMKSILFRIVVLLSVISITACEKQDLSPETTIENQEVLREAGDGTVVSAAKAPLILLAKNSNGSPQIYPAAGCFPGSLDAYGVRYVVDPVTFNFYYQGHSPYGLNLEVQTTGGSTVLNKFDALCLDPDRDRNTLHDFVCAAVGPPTSLSPSTTYRMRLYIGSSSSPWYYFTTPAGPVCGM